MKIKSNFKFCLAVFNEINRQYWLAFQLQKCYKNFFICWQAIHRQQIDHQKIKKITIVSLETILFLTILRVVQFLILVCVPMSHFGRFLLWDPMLFIHVEPNFNYFYALIAPMAMFIYGRLYFYSSKLKNGQISKRETVPLVFNFLGLNNNYCPIEDPLIRVDSKIILKLLRKYFMILNFLNIYFGKNIYFSLLLNLICINFFIFIYTVCIYYYFLVKIIIYIAHYPRYFFTQIQGLLCLAVFVFNGSTAFIYTFCLIMQFILHTTTLVIFTFVLFWRLKQINKLLGNNIC